MIVGVTGTFGSGKTTVSRMLASELKMKVVDADALAKKEFRENRARIEKLFGSARRNDVSETVFGDRRKLARLEKIIHPGVIQSIKSSRNAVVDVPLLIESDLHKLCDFVVVVYCGENQRIKRLGKKGFSSGEIENRTKNQMPFRKKARYADYVVDNSAAKANTLRQIRVIARDLVIK